MLDIKRARPPGALAKNRCKCLLPGIMKLKQRRRYGNGTPYGAASQERRNIYIYICIHTVYVMFLL